MKKQKLIKVGGEKPFKTFWFLTDWGTGKLGLSEKSFTDLEKLCDDWNLSIEDFYRVRSKRTFGKVTEGEIGGVIDYRSKLSDTRLWFDKGSVLVNCKVSGAPMIKNSVLINCDVSGDAYIEDSVVMGINGGRVSISGRAVIEDCRKIFTYNSLIIKDYANLKKITELNGDQMIIKNGAHIF